MSGKCYNIWKPGVKVGSDLSGTKRSECSVSDFVPDAETNTKHNDARKTVGVELHSASVGRVRQSTTTW